MSNEFPTPPPLLSGRVEPAHRLETLLYQQKVQALIQVATEYAHDPTDRTLTALVQIAVRFKEEN